MELAGCIPPAQSLIGDYFTREQLPRAMVAWHVQVAVLLVGHVVSIGLAHGVALRTFGARRIAVPAQVPMLLLMVGYTVFGLWILSLPLAMG